MEKIKVTGGFGVDFNFPDDPHFSETMSRVMSNVVRVNNLISLYENLRVNGKKTRGRSNVHFTEILRAAVVLMHATLEDGLRSLLRFRLPRTKEALDGICLVGLNEIGRPEKFLLGDLARFTERTVGDIFEDSIRAHLSYQSFNNATDVARALRACKIDLSDVEPLLKSLSVMISRRHHIVHNADINEKRGKAGHQFARSIGSAEVKEWNGTIVALFATVSIQFASERLAKKVSDSR